jgi:hypothetical protein
MTWITFRDVLYAELWVQTSQIVAVLIGNPITGDGKCRVVCVNVVAEVTPATAQEILAVVTDPQPAIDVRSDPLTPTRQ